MKPMSWGVGLWLCLVWLATAVQAETMLCAERTAIVDRLAEVYGETRQAIGLASPREIVEVFASGETGSWTIIVTRPDGTTCLMAAGEHFETIEGAPLPAALGDPA